MTHKILKYTLSNVDAEQKISIPAFSQVLSVGMQDDCVRVWVLADQSQPMVKRTFRMVGTGHPLDHDFTGRWDFVGRVDLTGPYQGLVYHIFVLQVKYEVPEHSG